MKILNDLEQLVKSKYLYLSIERQTSEFKIKINQISNKIMMLDDDVLIIRDNNVIVQSFIQFEPWENKGYLLKCNRSKTAKLHDYNLFLFEQDLVFIDVQYKNLINKYKSHELEIKKKTIDKDF
jgi:hypothetical protein